MQPNVYSLCLFLSLSLLPHYCSLLLFLCSHCSAPPLLFPHLYPVLFLSLSPYLQYPEWWQCRLRCGWSKTTLHHCHWWKSTNNAAPRRASNMTTPFPDITIVWRLCRPEARRPATRYGDGHCKQMCTHNSMIQPALICILGVWIVILQQSWKFFVAIL